MLWGRPNWSPHRRRKMCRKHRMLTSSFVRITNPRPPHRRPIPLLSGGRWLDDDDWGSPFAVLMVVFEKGGVVIRTVRRCMGDSDYPGSARTDNELGQMGERRVHKKNMDSSAGPGGRADYRVPASDNNRAYPDDTADPLPPHMMSHRFVLRKLDNCELIVS
jgi:hypothetical protein